MATQPSGQPHNAHIDAELEVVEARKGLADAEMRLADTEDELGLAAEANKHRHEAAEQLGKATSEVLHVQDEMAHMPTHADPAKNGGRTASPRTWPRGA